MNNNDSLFAYINNLRDISKNKLINLGILINSGGIVGILSITKGKELQGSLKLAFCSFIISICVIFLAELTTTILANNSLSSIIKIETQGKKAELRDVSFGKGWPHILIWIFDFLALFYGFHALKHCFRYIGLNMADISRALF